MAMTRFEFPSEVVAARVPAEIGSTEQDAARRRNDTDRALIASRALRGATSKGMATRWLIENR
jgi:hypothetical protein